VSGSESRTERTGGRRPPLRRVLVLTHAGLSACFALAAIVASVVIDQQHHEATIRFDATRNARSLASSAAVVWDRPTSISAAIADQTTRADGVEVRASDQQATDPDATDPDATDENLIVRTGPVIPELAASKGLNSALGGNTGAELISASGQSVVVAWTPVTRDGRVLGAVTLMEPVSPGLAHTGDLAGVLALAALAVLAAGVLGWIVGRWIAGPFELLADSAYQGAIGNPPAPIPRRAVREAGMLASTLRSALERSEQARLASVRQAERQRLLVQQMSHNLRTPLSVLTLRLEQFEMLEGSEDADAARERIVARLRDQLTVLASQIDEVITQTESMPPGQENPVVDLGQVVTDRLAGLRALAGHRGQRIVTDIKTGVRTKAVAAELGAVVDELVVNAIKFAPERSVIRISVDADNMSHSALLVVSDQGPGIPASERKEVVKSGVRGVHATGMPGTGLGLHLVSEILEASHGSLHLRDVTDGTTPNGNGLEARVALPLDQDD
jgi:signal transduction histidine kinase